MDEKITYTDLHAQLYDSLMKYLDARVVAKHDRWSEADAVDEDELRSVFREMGSYGWIMPWAEERYGGLEADVLSSCVIAGALGYKGLMGVSVWLHGEMAGPYLAKYGTVEQKERYLAPAVAGEDILCIAMTEPDAGSDLASIKTTAVHDGDGYVINGNKCFISNGSVADTILVACKAPDVEGQKNSMSLFVVEADTPGVTRRPIRKIGGNSMDTAELFFEDVRVPAENLIGEPGKAYKYLMSGLEHERLIAAVHYQGVAARAIELTCDYVKERRLFGKRLADQQSIQFQLAELYARVSAGRAMVKEASLHFANDPQGPRVRAEISAAKMYTAQLAQDCLRAGVQLHGGYGVCQEYEIGRLYIESLTFSVAAGTSEIMKMLVGRSLLPRER